MIFSTHLFRDLWYGGAVFDAAPRSPLFDAFDPAPCDFALWKDFKTRSEILGKVSGSFTETTVCVSWNVEN